MAAAVQLNDRKAFLHAVSSTYNAIKALLEKYQPGTSASADAFFATTQATGKNDNTYTFDALTDTDNGLIPGALATDSAVAIGSDIGKLAPLAHQLTGNTSVCGVIININLAPPGRLL